MMLAVGFSYMAFIMLRYATSGPTLLSVFSINECCSLSNAFSACSDRMCDFCLSFFYVIYYLYCFANIVPSLHPWDESDLIMVYDLFSLLLYVICQYVVEDFRVYVQQQNWPIIFFFFVSLSDLGIILALCSQDDAGFIKSL